MPQTLLLADDSLTIQRVIELTFADEDIKVVAVSDGDRAIDRIEADPPDIVLVDVGMPGKSGYEVARHIKQSTRLSQIPVLLLTGAFDPVDQAKVAEAGCDGVLAKPFEPQLVVTRVKELLGRGGDVAKTAPSPEVEPTRAADEGVEPVAAPPVEPAEAARLDRYFAQLDAAFASLSDSPSARAVADSEPWEPLPVSSVPLSMLEEAPESAAVPLAAQPAIEMPQRHASEPASLPSLGDAFAAILAAEQREATAPAAWPVSAAAPAALNDDVVEEIVRRVLARLSDQIVRETVSELVADVAERLVREEIERLKSGIQ